MKQLIEVKKKHIKNGVPRRTNMCPVSLAIKDEINCYEAYVDDKLCVSDFKYQKTYFHVPRSVERFIQKFDSEKSVKPFKFWLNPIK